MKKLCFTLQSVVLAGLALFAVPAFAAEVPQLKFPEEQTAWNAITARFISEPVVKDGKISTEIAVTGLKSDSKAATATASITIDKATGHVVGVTSNAAKFSDEEFKLFASFPELKSITLWHNSGGFTGKGIAYVASLPKLEKLTLAGGGLDNSGMAEAAKLKGLKELRAWHCAFDDAGVALFKGSPTLEGIAIGPQWSSRITDKSLESISQCPKMKKITVSDTYLTWDNGLKHLVALKGTLTDIDLADCLIEPADVEHLKKELPNVKITWKGLAAAGAPMGKSYVRSTAQKWIPKEIIEKAIAEAAKNPPAATPAK
jgi:hypothetical protein